MSRRIDVGGSPSVRWAVAVLIGLGMAACANLSWQPMGPQRTDIVPGAKSVRSDECTACHEVIQGHARIADYHGGCESCHGAGSLHSASEQSAEIRFPSNSDCLTCHAAGYGTHLQWGTGDHSRAGVICSDCHNPHNQRVNHLRLKAEPGLPFMDSASALCVQCHKDIASRLRFPSHHPVGEGKMKCISCHDPHEDSRLRSEATNVLCESCHQGVQGPWLFEHEPVAERCGFCHDPHGTVTTNLQATVQPALCLTCHTLNDRFHHDSFDVISGDYPTLSEPGELVQQTGAPTFLRNCTNCHSAIHGSVTDEHLRH